MKTMYRTFRQFYSKRIGGIGACALWLLYSCHGTHQLGMDQRETTEPTVQETIDRTWLPQVIQDPHNEEQVYCEVPNLSDDNRAWTNIANAMTMAHVVQQTRSTRLVLVTNYTHLQENRDNEIQYLETKCNNLFGNVENLRRYQNHILVAINQAPLPTRLSDMRTWLRQMGSPTMQILANRIFLFDPLNRSNDNPDFWSRERCNAELARIPLIPEAMATNLYQTMLSDNDKVVLQRCLDHQVATIKNAIAQDDYTAIGQYWDFIKRGRSIAPSAVVALNGQELLSMKLNKPTIELDTADSAAVVNYSAVLGDQNAALAADKLTAMFAGMTNAGKSTTVNHLVGCELTTERDELGEETIIVDPESRVREVTPIGHGEQSRTFLPQITPDPNNNNQVYCDCPGFSDNRGAEINIANAINIKRILQQARGVKAIFLTDYQGLRQDRGESFRNLGRMCVQMFGSVDSLRRYQNSVLLGVNRVPAHITTQNVRDRIMRIGSDATAILANRAFLYDPLERGGADLWSRERFLEEIERMPAIPQRTARDLFQTVLNNDDKALLQRIVEHQVGIMNTALEQEDYPAVDRGWDLLNKLQIIGHRRIEELMERQVRPRMRAYVAARTAALNRHAAAHQFEEAEQMLTALQALNRHFPNENFVDLERLQETLQTARAQHTAQQEAEEAKKREAEAKKRAEEERERARRERENMEARLRRREAELEEARRRRNNIPDVKVTVSIPIPCTIM